MFRVDPTQPSPHWLRAAYVIAMLFSPSWLPTSYASSRLLHLDDILAVEGFGRAEPDPAGRWMLYEKQRPYDQITDYSFRTYAFAKTGHQIWRYDLKKGGQPERLPGLDPEPHSYLQGFSPSGAYVAIMQYQLGALSVSTYDIDQQRSIRVDYTPAFSATGEHNPVWVSDEELAFSALPHDRWPSATSVRAFTGRVLQRSWQDAWRGHVPTAHEVRTFPEDRSHEQELGYLVLANARTGATQVLSEGLYSDLRPSPDGRYLAGLSVSKPRPMNSAKLVTDLPSKYSLTVFDLAAGTYRRLAPELEFLPYTIAWAPDGQRLAAFGWQVHESRSDGRFHVVNVTTGRVTHYNHPNLDLASERERGGIQRPERTAFLGNDIAVFARKISDESGASSRFTYQDVRSQVLSDANWYALSPDGSARNLTHHLRGISNVPVHAGDNSITVIADDGVHRFLADGTHSMLTPPELVGRFTTSASGTFATRANIIRPEFATDALIHVDNGSRIKILIASLREQTALTNKNHIIFDTKRAIATPLAGSYASHHVLYRTEDGPVSRLMLAQGNAAPREIDAINTHLANVDFGKWEIVSYTLEDPNGKLTPQTVQTCVLLPPGHNGSPLPLIVDVYPNARQRCNEPGPVVPYPDPISPYLWASQGYAYARLATPRNLIRSDSGPIAGIDEALTAGVDAIARQGLADPERVALFGYSQGAISALYAAAHSHKFKAVIAVNGWANLVSHYFGANGIYSHAYGEHFGNYARYDHVAGSDFGIGRSPFQDLDVYYRSSPVLLALNIEPPVMLIHSDMDGFSMSQFDEMYGALQRAGKDVRYVRYFGEGHGPSSPANIRDMWQRMSAFLASAGVGHPAIP